MENASLYGFNQPVPQSQYRPVKYAQRTVALPAKGKVEWTQLAKQLNCDYKELRLLNPHILEYPLSGNLELRVPVKR